MKKTTPVLACLLLLATVAGIAAPRGDKLDYPVAPRDQITTDYFGTQVPAPYRWMEDMQSPALHSWVDAENRLTDGYLV
jgi:prolyl oligopeptidase